MVLLAGAALATGAEYGVACWLVDVSGNPPVVVGLCGVAGVVAILTVLPALRDA